jgi:hypothetical protein
MMLWLHTSFCNKWSIFVVKLFCGYEAEVIYKRNEHVNRDISLYGIIKIVKVVGSISIW